MKGALVRFEAKMKKLQENKRYITSVVYVVVLMLLFTLKWLVQDWGALGFDVLFCAISVIGCIEFLTAVKVVPFAQRTVTVAFCAMIIPAYVIFQMLDLGGYIPVGVIFLLYAIVVVIFGLTKFDGSNLNTTLLSMAAAGYTGLLSCVFAAVNHATENSAPLVLLMFLIVMLTDSLAYVFGKLFRRWMPQKLAPKISPNKTIIGGIGGIIGGIIAGVVAYYLWFGLSKVTGYALMYRGFLPAYVAFMLIGLVGAIVGQAGDLFESFFKRKCGIKDSGKLLPGHGGVLDRFDSMFFVGVLVWVASFLLLL